MRYLEHKILYHGSSIPSFWFCKHASYACSFLQLWLVTKRFNIICVTILIFWVFWCRNICSKDYYLKRLWSKRLLSNYTMWSRIEEKIYVPLEFYEYLWCEFLLYIAFCCDSAPFLISPDIHIRKVDSFLHAWLPCPIQYRKQAEWQQYIFSCWHCNIKIFVGQLKSYD